MMKLTAHHIEVPWAGPCLWCGFETTTAEAFHAQTWLCEGMCTDDFLRASEAVRRQVGPYAAMAAS